MRRNRPNNQRGFTLVENMIGSMILAAVLYSTLSLGGQCFRQLSDIRRGTQATQVLYNKMEELRRMPVSSIQGSPTTFTSNGFQGKLTITNYGSYKGQTTLLRVTLTTSWRNRWGREVNSSLSTLFSSGGMNSLMYE